MTIKEELIDYANRCLAGEEISGKKHKWACMRFLRIARKRMQRMYRLMYGLIIGMKRKHQKL